MVVNDENLNQEAQELYKRTMFLWRKAKNGKWYHLKQVIKILDGLAIHRQWVDDYGYNQVLIYTFDNSMTLLDAIARKVIPENWEWEVIEDMTGRIELQFLEKEN